MNSQAPCPRCEEGTIPIVIAPAEPNVGIMSSYLDDVGSCDSCAYQPLLEPENDGEIERLQEQAIDHLCEEER